MPKACPKRLEDWLQEQLRDPVFAGQYLTNAITSRYDMPERDQQGFLAAALMAIAAAHNAEVSLRDLIATKRLSTQLAILPCSRPSD